MSALREMREARLPGKEYDVRNIKSADPEARFGQVGERWGNLPLPAGAFAVDDLFRFRNAPAEAPTFKVIRILGLS